MHACTSACLLRVWALGAHTPLKFEPGLTGRVRSDGFETHQGVTSACNESGVLGRLRINWRNEKEAVRLSSETKGERGSCAIYIKRIYIYKTHIYI